MSGRHRAPDGPPRLSPNLHWLLTTLAWIGVTAPPVALWAQSIAPVVGAP